MNNSTERAVPRLYVEHTAASDRGGFVIVSAARYELSLAPSESTTLEVVEEAEYVADVASDAEVRALLEGREASGAAGSAPIAGLDAAVAAELRALLRRRAVARELRALLPDGAAASRGPARLPDDATLHRWRETVARWARDDAEAAERGTGREEGGSASSPTAAERVTMPPELLALCERARARASAQAESERVARAQAKRVETIFENQARLRENLNALTSSQQTASAPLVARYLHDLDAEEDELIAARREKAAMLDAAAAAERELAALRLDLGASARDALARLEGGR